MVCASQVLTLFINLKSPICWTNGRFSKKRKSISCTRSAFTNYEVKHELNMDKFITKKNTCCDYVNIFQAIFSAKSSTIWKSVFVYVLDCQYAITRSINDISHFISIAKWIPRLASLYHLFMLMFMPENLNNKCIFQHSTIK